MNRTLLQSLAGTILMLATTMGCTQNQKSCVDTAPPSIWVWKTPYPFQAGAEKAFDELYHGPWRAQVDVVLYATPRGHRVVGKVKAGTVVKALVAESIVVHPLRFVAAQDFRVVKSSIASNVQVATVHKGDVFWVLNLQGEGGFSVWWRCSVVGWDSAEPGDVDTDRLELLGTNEVRWVKVQDKKTGLSGWIKDFDKLEPAQPTTKAVG
ncbi:MAG TPA: hypothetical protein VN776_02440 [Terracidiphilus sp.]|nr:hypothetical protein [Terracidiphilus sp.]